jgi:predicted metal-dependent phosphoesterase TrpH
MRLDLHVHGVRSPDSRLTMAELVASLGPAGLQGIALTDHNTIAGHEALRELGARYPRYVFLGGVEVSTKEGHLLVLGTEELPPIHRPLDETLDWARSRDLVTVLAHPMRRVHGVGRAIAASASVSAIETMNGHNREIANARAAHLAAQRQIGETGGSDAHRAADVGRAYTDFPDDATDPEALLGAIRRGRTTAQGRSATAWEALRSGGRSTVLRIRRGFRSI